MNRYDRQMRVTQIGSLGQAKIGQTTLLILGAGAIGSHVADICTRMGFKKLILMDRDFVELTNLQRQTLYTEEDVQQKLPKAEAAKQHLMQVNKETLIESIVDDIRFDGLVPYVEEIDFILDCTDNFTTRRMLNDFCLTYDIPWIYASCAGTYASVMPIIPHQSPCLTCLIGVAPQTNEASCEWIGVHAALVPIVAGFQISLLTKMLLTDSFSDFGYYQLDNFSFQFQKINLKKKIDCPVCGKRSISRQVHHSETAQLLCGKDTVQFRLSKGEQADFMALKQILYNERIQFNENPFILSFAYDDYSFSVFKNGRILVHGTSNMQEAKKAYHLFFN